MIRLFFFSLRSPFTNLLFCSNRAIGDDKRKLLGQHVWKDILLNPSEGEKRHRSGIYYCVYQNIRDVQKEGMLNVFMGQVNGDLSFHLLGWKRIDFEVR